MLAAKSNATLKQMQLYGARPPALFRPPHRRTKSTMTRTTMVEAVATAPLRSGPRKAVAKVVGKSRWYWGSSSIGRHKMKDHPKHIAAGLVSCPLSDQNTPLYHRPPSHSPMPLPPRSTLAAGSVIHRIDRQATHSRLLRNNYGIDPKTGAAIKPTRSTKETISKRPALQFTRRRRESTTAARF